VIFDERVRRDVRILWEFSVVDSGAVRADLLLVLGSHDLRVADRAAELYLGERAAPSIIVTGGSGKITRLRWNRPEAEIYADRLMRLGVPGEVVLREPRAANTGENVVFARELAREAGLRTDSGIIVCKPYTGRRALAVARLKWPEPTWSVRPPAIPLWEYPSDDVPLAEMVNLLVGDVQRLRVYPPLGFQAPVEVPEHVWAAYGRLVAAGFDQFVIR
jgi:uncharacterized SAM-binding protein YcdF (DUF218 family)